MIYQKTGFVFLRLETQKKINIIVRMQLFSVWIHYFFQLNFNRRIPNKHSGDCGNYVCNISVTFQETLCEEYVGGEVKKNMPGLNAF